MKTALSLIYSKKLIDTLTDFSTNTEHFAHFGIRFLEIMSLSFPVEIATDSGIISVISGLLRTNDYETVVQCLSFIAVLAQSTSLTPEKNTYESKLGVPNAKGITQVINPKILTLILKTCAKKPEVEYVHYALQIVEMSMKHKELRHLVIRESLRLETDLPKEIG